MSISLSAIAWEIDPLHGSASNGGGFNWAVASPGTDKSYGVGQAATARTDLVCGSIGAPSAPAVNASGSGGTVAAGTYSVAVTYAGGGGETLPSSSSPVTVGSGQDIAVTSPGAATGADHYKVYISAVGTTTPLFLQNGPSGTAIGSPYTLTSAVNTATANPPGSDSSGILLTSAGTAFNSTDVGNLVQVTAGTGWTLGFYAVQGVAGSTAILDRSPAAAGTTGGTGTLGGALASPLNLPPVPGSNRVFIKGDATCTMGGTWTIAATAVDGFATPPTLVSGYGSTRGDGGMATLQASANSSTLVNFTGNGGEVQNLILDCNNKSGSTGCNFAQYSSMRNCSVRNFTTNGLNAGTNCMVFDSEFTGGGAASHAIRVDTGCFAVDCYVHDNNGVGLYSPSTVGVVGGVFANNIGAFSDGMQVGPNSLVYRVDVRGNGRYGVSNGGVATNYAFCWTNNIISGNGTAGMLGASQAGIAANSASDGNAFYNNGAGGTVNRLNMDDGTATSVNPINAVAPYADAHDKSLTGDPYVNAAGGNFALNSTGGAGASCRAAVYPPSITGLSGTTGYGDLGAFQHQDSGGGTAPPRINSILIN